MAQTVESACNAETQVRPLAQGPLEKGEATHSDSLAWGIPGGQLSHIPNQGSKSMLLPVGPGPWHSAQAPRAPHSVVWTGDHVGIASPEKPLLPPGSQLWMQPCSEFFSHQNDGIPLSIDILYIIFSLRVSPL